VFLHPNASPLVQHFTLLRSHLTTLGIQHNSPSVKRSESAGGGDLREASSRCPCQPFQRLISSLGSITGTLSLTGECAYANAYKSGWTP